MEYGDEQIDRLIAKARWLDQHRRRLGILAGLFVAPTVFLSLAPGWPRAHGIALVSALGIAAWWIAETIMGVVIATWETEANIIAKDKGLPRATLLTRND